jgi:single-strand DNA-binding protein
MSVYNNTVVFKGNIGKEPEFKETTAGHVATFSIAVYRSGKGNDAVTDWFNCVAWNDIARGVANLNKGTRVVVIGSVINRSYDNKEGVRKYITEIQVREIGLDVAVKKEGGNEELSEDSPF